MKNLIKLALLIVLGTAFHAQATAVYTNGPIGGVAHYSITGNTISDSFTVSSPTSLSSVELGLVTFFGGVPTSMGWAIGTTFFGSEISSGTASSLTNTFWGLYSGGGQGYTSEFSLSGSLLVPGTTYYFTLSNPVSSDGGRVSWDTNSGVGGDGPSMAEVIFLGTGAPIASHSFTLFGPAAVPESGSTIGLLLLAGAALFGIRRFRSVA